MPYPSGGVLGTYGADYLQGIQNAGLPVTDMLAANYDAHDEAFGKPNTPNEAPPNFGTAPKPSEVPQLPPIQQAGASNVQFAAATPTPWGVPRQGMLTPTPAVTPVTLAEAQAEAKAGREYYSMFAQNLEEKDEAFKKSRTA
jgi:hypothetical protein